jgi:CMP-N-acetylneuraminic acid synthetase
MKNLALAGGKPLIYYAIKAARDSGVFKSVIVNSEDAVFAEIAKRYKAGFYRRPSRLATSAAKSDFVVYDFMENNPCDIVAWVNPTSPLQAGAEIRAVVEYFIKEGLDSLITVKNEQVHCVFKGKPVNFAYGKVFAQTQDLTPVQPFVYSVMMWRSKMFMKAFEEKGHAFFCGKTGFFPVSKLSAVIIKRDEDLALADYVLRSMKNGTKFKVRYDRAAGKAKGAKLK